MGAVTLRPRAGSGALGWNCGDLAGCALNPRVSAGIPLGGGVGGGFVAGVSERGRRVAGVAVVYRAG